MKRWSVMSSFVRPPRAVQGLFSRSWVVLPIALASWMAASWYLVDRYENGLTDSYLRRERSSAERDLYSINLGVSRSWEIAGGFLTTLAHQDSVRAALERIDNGPKTNRKFIDDPQLSDISRTLFSMVSDLKVLSIISLLNAQGDCIAASNGAAANSLVGTNYSDRQYFHDARNGANGGEFATGRATGQPGLFLSVPVTHEGIFLGAVMAKFDSSSFAPWLNFTDALVADDHGVILFARDNNFLYKAIPGGRIDALPTTERMALYKRSSFNTVPLTRWSPDLSADIVKLDDRPGPVLLVTAPLSVSNGVVGVVHPLPRLLLLDRDRWRMFALVAIGGGVALIVLYGLIRRLQDNRTRRRVAEDEVAFHQSLIDAAALAIAVYSEDGHCLAANDAMADLFGTTRPQMARHNFRSNHAWAEAGLINAASHVLEAGTAQRGHWRLSSGFGKEVWIDATLKRFTYQARNFLLVIFSDVTDQHWRDNLLTEG